MEYSTVVKPLAELKSAKPISFEGINLRRISIMSSELFNEQSASISTIGGALTKSFVFKPDSLDSDAGNFNFKFEIECDIEKITGDLVTRNHQIETSDDEKNTYWLSAEIKELSSVLPVLRRMDLLDIPFILDVAVHQDVKIRFPDNRTKELKLISDWAHTTDKNVKSGIDFQHIRLKKTNPKEKDITKLLMDLQEVFIEDRFSAFIDVLHDFYYYDCQRGAEFYEQIPFRSFPKWMSVICRTSVSTENPASDGELVYKKAEFQDAIEKAVKSK